MNIKSLFCKHDYEEKKGQSGYFMQGIEYHSYYFECKKCKKKINVNTPYKDHWTKEERKEKIKGSIRVRGYYE